MLVRQMKAVQMGSTLTPPTWTLFDELENVVSGLGPKVDSPTSLDGAMASWVVCNYADRLLKLKPGKMPLLVQDIRAGLSKPRRGYNGLWFENKEGTQRSLYPDRTHRIPCIDVKEDPRFLRRVCNDVRIYWEATPALLAFRGCVTYDVVVSIL